MIDSALTARLADLRNRLTQPSPAPLEGQETISLGEDPNEPDRPSTRPAPPSQPPLW